MENEFEEIAHCGGKFTIKVSTNESGQRGVQYVELLSAKLNSLTVTWR